MISHGTYVLLLFATVASQHVVLVKSNEGEREKRIVNGRGFEEGEEVEWQAAMLRNTWISNPQWLDDDQFYPTCGASLIRQNWVVTAGHCVRNTDATQVRVHINATDLRNVLQGTPLIRVSRIIQHEDYDPGTFTNDIALLQLEREDAVELKTIQLGSGQFAADSTNCTITGFGKTTYTGSASPTLLRAEVTMRSDEDCFNFIRKTGVKSMHPGQLCAGGGRTDSCQGDSGGPLVCCPLPNTGDLTNQECTLEGTVSYGVGCGEPGNLGVYSRVTYFKDWILQHIGEA